MGNNVIITIFDLINENQIVNNEQIKELELKKDEPKEFINSLKNILGESFIDLINFCYEKELFNKENYDSLFIENQDNTTENNEEDSIDTFHVSIEKDAKNNEEQKRESIKEDEENIIKNDLFLEKDIKELINSKKNLYKIIPGNKIDKKDNIFYTKTQLYRFIDSGASDLIIETQKQGGLIQYKIIFKIDGENELQDASNWARPEDTSDNNQNLFFESVRRYIGANLGRINADLKHVMQDGSFSLDYKDSIRDFRLNSMPTRCYGIAYPRYVQRLATEGDSCDFDSIQMLPHAKKLYEEMINNRISGTILVTGPTGHGKTTTIYSMLNKINKDKFSVLSVEKPIESQLYGVNQTEVDSIERDDKKERYTNLDALRGILRQALDVVFIGEMRDSVEIIEGINTGLIGNKLITTLHTNSGIDTILRLISEGVNTNAIGNGVKYTTAQRLVNKLCPHCSIEDPKKIENLKQIKKTFKRSQIFFNREFKKILLNIQDEDFNLDELELEIKENLSFIYNDDLKLLIDKLETNFKKIDSKKTKKEKIDLILEISKEFPYPKFRQEEILSRLDNATLKVANLNGCEHCREGYSGRIMIVEILKMDKAIKSYIHKDIKLNELEAFMLNRGHVTMEMYGYLLALEGIISIEKLKEFVEE